MEWIDKYWFELWGVFLILCGVYACVKRKVGIGFEFEKPKSYIHGKVAVLTGVIVIIFGIWILTNSSDLKMNQCIEKGLVYSQVSGQCAQ